MNGFMKRFPNTLLLFLLLHFTPALASPFPPELIGDHSGGMRQQGQSAKGGELCFEETSIGFGGVEIKTDGELVVSFAVGSEELKKLEFKFHNYESGRAEIWHPLKDGEDRYSASLFRYGSVFRILVKQHHKEELVGAIQWICAESRKPEQGGTDNPGEYSPVPVADKDVVSAAAFAIAAQKKVMKEAGVEPEGLKLIAIEESRQQVVAGMNYWIRMKVEIGGEEKEAEVIVWRQAWRKPDPDRLTQWMWK